MVTQYPQEPRPGDDLLDARLRDLAASPSRSLEWWRKMQSRLERDEKAREFAAGPNGSIDVVVSRSMGGEVFRVIRRNTVSTPTDQAKRAIEWLDTQGFSAIGQEDDERIGVSLLTLESARTGEELLAALRSLRHRIPEPGTPRLVIGPDDITMEGMHVKAAGGVVPQPVPSPFGQHQDTGVGKGVTVAVIDGGFETSDHPRTDGWMDTVTAPPDGDATLDTDGDSRLDDGAGHGTFVTGAVLQVAPSARVVQYRALDSWGMGNTWRLKDCILDAAAAGAQIINLSVGFDDVDLLGSPALCAALDSLDSDVLVVAAAGNSGLPIPCLPAAHPRVLGVGALAGDLSPAVWSSFGPWVSFSTVGIRVASTYVVDLAQPEQDPVATWAGTSFAAPQISGLLAKYLSEGKTPSEAVAAVRADASAQTGTPHPDFGYRLRVL